MRRWIYPGSFDPPTRGHADLLQRSSALCDELVVAVLDNPEKRCLFSLQQRLEMLRLLTDRLDNVRIVTFDGLQVQLYAQQQACAVVRGVRNAEDLEYEFSLAHINSALLEGFETVWLPTKPALRACSSSFVRQLLQFDADCSFLLTPEVEDYILRMKSGGNEP